MLRWTTALFGALFLASLVLVIVEAGPAIPEPDVVEKDAGGSDSGGRAPLPDAAPPDDEEKLVEAPDDLESTGIRLPDGGPVPELPRTAPRRVEFGVVLITYRDAQLAAKDARPRAEARRIANDLLELARSDFEEAVKQGDRGSTENAGTIPRGVLEPAIEYALFTLGEGEVYGAVLDTPRGFWIVRRND